jgi:hypothetical protein
VPGEHGGCAAGKGELACANEQTRGFHQYKWERCFLVFEAIVSAFSGLSTSYREISLVGRAHVVGALEHYVGALEHYSEQPCIVWELRDPGPGCARNYDCQCTRTAFSPFLMRSSCAFNK